MKPHGWLRSGLQPFGHRGETRRHVLPVVQRRLQGAGDVADLGAAGQIPGDDDQPAVPGAILEGCKFHGFEFRFRVIGCLLRRADVT